MEPNRYRLIQDGQVVASTEGEHALREIKHYALVYAQDGPVTIQKRRDMKWENWETDNG